MRVKNFLVTVLVVTTLYGCSSFVESTRKSLLGDDKSPRNKVKQEPKWVSKNQYDELLTKYKNLNDRYQNLKEEKLTSKKTFNQLDEMAANKSGSESIDVFGDKGLAAAAAVKSAKIPSSPAVKIDKSQFDEDLDYYSKGVALYDNGKTDEAFKIFQFLENSKTRQLRVRAKLRVGEHYLANGQYDLGLQVFESIIREHAFSGAVIPSLKHAVVCTEKLGLTDKKLKYESILRDFFEVQV